MSDEILSSGVLEQEAELQRKKEQRITDGTNSEKVQIDPAIAKNLSDIEYFLRKNAGLPKNGERKEHIGFFGQRPDAISLASALDNEVAEDELKENVDSVVTNLAQTLANIGIYSIEEYKQNPTARKEYLDVAKTVNLLVLALKESSEGNVTFQRNVEGEDEYYESSKDGAVYPDRVFIYNSGPIRLRGQRFNNISFFIRPDEYVREATLPDGTTKTERRQARTTLKISSPNLPRGSANIRIDPSRDEESLTYDVIVGNDDNNLVDVLNLVPVGQEGGHHFHSQTTFTNPHIQLWQIHEAIACRLDTMTATPQKVIPFNTPETRVTDLPAKSEDLAA